MREDVVFPLEALESRLAEVESRKDTLLARMDSMTGAGEAAESALYQARQRLQEAETHSDKQVLQEHVHAREDELATARKGVEYRDQLKTLGETARALLQRRYALLQGSEPHQWPAWLRETQESLRKIGKDRDFALAALSALRAKELALGRRIAAPDLDAGIREAVLERIAAIEAQSQLAEEMLLIQDQVRSLAQRLRLDLEPRVRERSLEQRMEQARDRLTAWWNAEIAVVQDHGIQVRDALTALGVFVLVFLLVWLLQLLLRRRLLPRLTAETGQGAQGQTLRAVVSPLIRNTSQVLILVVAFYTALAVSGLGEDKLKDSNTAILRWYSRSSTTSLALTTAGTWTPSRPSTWESSVGSRKQVSASPIRPKSSSCGGRQGRRRRPRVLPLDRIAAEGSEPMNPSPGACCAIDNG